MYVEKHFILSFIIEEIKQPFKKRAKLWRQPTRIPSLCIISIPIFRDHSKSSISQHKHVLKRNKKNFQFIIWLSKARDRLPNLNVLEFIISIISCKMLVCWKNGNGTESQPSIFLSRQSSSKLIEHHLSRLQWEVMAPFRGIHNMNHSLN